MRRFPSQHADTPLVQSWPETGETDVLRTSFAKLAPHADAFAEQVYAKMFDAAPELRKLFPSDMQAQRALLMQMLESIVANVDKPDEVQAQLRSLGARHRGYGVHGVHFVVFRAAVIATLRELPELHFRKDEVAAWDKMVRGLAAGMGFKMNAAA